MINNKSEVMNFSMKSLRSKTENIQKPENI